MITETRIRDIVSWYPFCIARTLNYVQAQQTRDWLLNNHKQIQYGLDWTLMQVLTNDYVNPNWKLRFVREEDIPKELLLWLLTL